MTYDDFVGQVQNRARLGSMGDAVSAIRATLENFANRIDVDTAYNLASQLPREIGYYLINAPRRFEEGERFTLDEFFERVGYSEPADFSHAVLHARVVMEVTQEAVSRGQVREIVEQLPTEFGRLFISGSVTHGSESAKRPRVC